MEARIETNRFEISVRQPRATRSQGRDWQSNLATYTFCVTLPQPVANGTHPLGEDAALPHRGARLVMVTFRIEKVTGHADLDHIHHPRLPEAFGRSQRRIIETGARPARGLSQLSIAKVAGESGQGIDGGLGGLIEIPPFLRSHQPEGS
jgi:hypothetical protein